MLHFKNRLPGPPAPAYRGRQTPRTNEGPPAQPQRASALCGGRCFFCDEAQGISNIAWALATLELTGWAPDMAPARSFLEAAMHSFADPAIPGPDNMRVRPKTFGL